MHNYAEPCSVLHNDANLLVKG